MADIIVAWMLAETTAVATRVTTTAIGQYAKDSGLEGRWRIWLECKLLEGAIGEELGVYLER